MQGLRLTTAQKPAGMADFFGSVLYRDFKSDTKLTNYGYVTRDNR